MNTWHESCVLYKYGVFCLGGSHSLSLYEDSSLKEVFTTEWFENNMRGINLNECRINVRCQ